MGKSKNTKLKIGLIFNSAEIPVWVSRIINEINDSSYASIDLLLISETNSTKPHSEKTWLNSLYSLYSRFEKYRWSGKGEDCLSIEQNSVPVKKEPIDPIEPEVVDIDSLKSNNLDVLLNLTGHDVSDDFIMCAESGVWSLHYQNGDTKMRTSPVGFWEVYDAAATMELTLEASFKLQGKPALIYRSVFATDDRSSAWINRSKAYRISKIVVLRKLKQLFEIGSESFLASHVDADEVKVLATDKVRSNPPGNLRMVRFFTLKLLNSVKMRVMNFLFTEQWSLRYRLSDGMSTDFNKFEKLSPSLGGLWADPFITYHEGSYYLFIEDAIYDKENADISVMKIEEGGTLGPLKPCLVRPYHLSYPFIFFWEGDHYMIPETKSNNAIEVYKATRFPDQWEFHSNLMEDVKAVDSTLLFHNNKWWLFANFKQEKWVSINNELSIYYADSPLSDDWTPHPMNPVISDVRSARPAGRIYEHDGRLIRPSQDSSVRYGYGLRLSEIVTLTETDYEEREVDFIEPTWDKMLRGTHTLAHAKNLTVIDVLEWRFRFKK